MTTGQDPQGRAPAILLMSISAVLGGICLGVALDQNFPLVWRGLNGLMFGLSVYYVMTQVEDLLG